MDRVIQWIIAVSVFTFHIVESRIDELSSFCTCIVLRMKWIFGEKIVYSSSHCAFGATVEGSSQSWSACCEVSEDAIESLLTSKFFTMGWARISITSWLFHSMEHKTSDILVSKSFSTQSACRSTPHVEQDQNPCRTLYLSTLFARTYACTAKHKNIHCPTRCQSQFIVRCNAMPKPFHS